MAKEVVKVGVANEKEISLEVDVVKMWEPTKISHFGTTVVFKYDDKYYSMTREDFNRIFEK